MSLFKFDNSDSPLNMHDIFQAVRGMAYIFLLLGIGSVLIAQAMRLNNYLLDRATQRVVQLEQRELDKKQKQEDHDNQMYLTGVRDGVMCALVENHYVIWTSDNANPDTILEKCKSKLSNKVKE